MQRYGGLHANIVSVYVPYVSFMFYSSLRQFTSVYVGGQGRGACKKFSVVVVVGGWSPSENSVCPRPLCQFYDSFTPVYVGQDRLSGTPVFISLRWFTFVGRDVEHDNKKGTKNKT